MPTLPTSSQKSESIQIGVNNGSSLEDTDDIVVTGGKWEDEEERRFFEDIQDLKDFVPKSVLGIDESEATAEPSTTEQAAEEQEREKEEVRKLEEELAKLSVADGSAHKEEATKNDVEEDEYVPNIIVIYVFHFLLRAPTPTPGTPKGGTPPLSPQLAPQGPSQLLTALLARLPDTTNRALIDQAAIDFAFLNSKAARKRLVRVQHSMFLNVQPCINRPSSSCHRYPRIGRTSFLITPDWWPR